MASLPIVEPPDIAAEITISTTSPINLNAFRRQVRPAFASPPPPPSPSTSTPTSPDAILRSHAAQNPRSQTRLVATLEASLAPATLQNYRRVQAAFQQFCVSRQFDFPIFDAAAVLEFILHLDEEKVGFAFISFVKPALSLLLETNLRSPASVFSPTLSRAIAGVKRSAAARRPDTRKMSQLTQEDLGRLFDVLVRPHLPAVRAIPLRDLRTMFRTAIIFYTFCRFRDFAPLRVRHFSLLSSGDIMIYFPEAKNDQLHNGNFTPILRSSPFPDPVFITHLFFERAGFTLSHRSHDDSFVNFAMHRHSRQPLPTQRLSYSIALRDLKTACNRAGIDSSDVGEKSAKMGGVSRALSAAVPIADIAAHGRWHSSDIVLRYRSQSEAHKLAVAAASFNQ